MTVTVEDEPRVRAPRPGEAMLACRCGRVLDAGQMRRPVRPVARTRIGLVEPIVCGACAVAS